MIAATAAHVRFDAASREGRRWQAPPTAGLRHPSGRALSHIGGERGLPIVGVMPRVLLDPMAFFRRLEARHGPVYRFHALGKWHVHAVGPEAHETILFDSANAFSAHEGWGPLVEPLLPGALLVRDGAEHRTRRRLLGEAFKQTELEGYQRIFARDVESRCRSWLGREVDVFPEMKRLSFDIAASTFLGMPLGQDSGRALGWFGDIAGGLLSISYNPWLSLARFRGLRGKARLEALLRRLIAVKRSEGGEDFLARMSVQADDSGNPIPEQQIADTFIFLLVAAHDTMSSALTSCTYFLAAHPEWGRRLRGELEEAGVASALEASGAKLPLMEMFYKEALRLNPPAPIVWRRATRDVRVCGRDIPAGTMTGINLMLSHRMETLWPEPDRFDPLRFTAEAERERDRFAYVPFGAGVHKCLGMHFSQQQARAWMTALLLTADLRLAGAGRAGWYHWPSCRPRGRFVVAADPRSPGKGISEA
jgi:cytochrome P450